MAVINATFVGRNGLRSDDGPHGTADGKVVFCTCTIDGTYDSSANNMRVAFCHANASDLQKMFGINWVKAIEVSGGGSASTTGTGKQTLRLDVTNQRFIILKNGADGAGAPVDSVEATNGNVYTGAAHLVFDMKILGD